MPESALPPTGSLINTPTTLSVHRCPVCSQPESRPLCSKDCYQIVSCIECGCDYVQNPPSEAQLKEYYGRQEWFEGGEQGGYQNYDLQTQESLDGFRSRLERFGDFKGSLLDVGCGYGSHLKVAAELGWRCFGIEFSDHARGVAVERLGDSATILASTDELIPHPFDVILLFDVIEHVSDPYSLFYPLFALGAIQPHTLVILTTPNAGSTVASDDPASWAYLHPPSHLTYFTQRSLDTLFRALRFTQVDIQGLYPLRADQAAPLEIENYAGLVLEASGSDFQAFMQERYVPSTWSEIAEYEHFPRYELACQSALGLRVLDFGCGTGYGTAMLARVAKQATGVDIDASALDWARRSHRHANLSFERSADFLADYEDDQFDLITCFEMIEHVSEADQHRALHALARVLRPQGLLFISTPNPETTNLYGANPYHLRELTRQEFLELLAGVFATVQIVDQYALAGVFFSAGQDSFPLQSLHGGPLSSATSLAYVAVCSHGPQQPLTNQGYLDTRRDYIAGRLRQERKLVQARLESYHHGELAKSLRLQLQSVEQKQQTHDQASDHLLELQLEEQNHQMSDLTRQITDLTNQLSLLTNHHSELNNQVGKLTNRAAELESELLLARSAVSAPVEQPRQPSAVSLSLPVRAGRAMLRAVRRRIRPQPPISTESSSAPVPVQLEVTDQAYTVRQPQVVSVSRPIVLHAIANFCLGGSSRLVVDLLEGLGDAFEQIVVTRHVPSPPAYLNLTIYEYAHPVDATPFEVLIHHYQPAFVHVHYWGDCDQDWYDRVYEACEINQIPVIQNVNTPVAPHLSSSICTNVYVSDFVRQIYGQSDDKAMVIHPGSDLEHFTVTDLSAQPDDCIGMVYRLEADKLDASSIDVFVKVAQRRPAIRCLIVGDGSLKPAFEERVKQGGVQDNFVFTGYVTYQDLPSFYAQMSIFVAPVWKESFGQVSSFAMNMGLPVVGYAVGAIPTIVDDQQLLADYGDSDALADIVIALIDDRDRRLSIGRRNQEKARAAYSVEAMVNDYRELYATMTTETA